MVAIQKKLWINAAAAFPGREAAKKNFDGGFYRADASVRGVWQQAEDCIGERLAQRCFSEKHLPKRLEMAALLTHCLSIYRFFSSRFGGPSAFLGFSQGEFTALTAAGVLPFPQVLRLLLRLESRLALPAGEECMYRIVDFPVQQLEKCCRQADPDGESLCVGAFLSETQNILSGRKERVLSAAALAKKCGARWAIRLDGERAYHSPLCRRIQEESAEDFAEMQVSAPAAPVYSCVDGMPSEDGNALRDKLSRQIASPILWQKLIRRLAESGIRELYEFGPGCTVSGNARLADGRMNCRWIGRPEDIGEAGTA